MSSAVVRTAPVLMQSTFSYDALGRMQTRTEADLTVSYAYDGLGRLLIAQPKATTQPQAVAATTLQPEFYAYDAQGALQVARWQGQDHDWRGQRIERDNTGLPPRVRHQNADFAFLTRSPPYKSTTYACLRGISVVATM